MIRRFAVCAFLIIAPAAFAAEAARPCGASKNAISAFPEGDVVLGREMALEVELAARTIDDPAPVDYVTRLSETLAHAADLTAPLKVRILDSDEANAAALPGGYLYVTAGLMEKVGSESELAAVLAHEIAHLAAGHSARPAKRAAIVNWATLPLVVTGWAGFAAREAVGKTMPLAFAGFARRMEAQADCLSIGYMEKAGYDPAAFVSALEKIADSGSGAGLLSAHPAASSRIERVQREIRDSFEPDRHYAENEAAFYEAQKRLANLRDHTGKIVVGLWPSLR